MLNEETRRSAAIEWAEVDGIENARRQRAWKTVKIQIDSFGFFVRIFSLSSSFSHKHVHVHWKVRILLSLARTELDFSERNGYSKFIRLPFGWRMKRRD